MVMDLNEKFQDPLNNFSFQLSFLSSSNYLQRLAFHDFLKVFQKNGENLLSKRIKLILSYNYYMSTVNLFVSLSYIIGS